MQRDPLWHTDSMNLYVYVVASPYVYIDPFGLQGVPLTGMIPPSTWDGLFPESAQNAVVAHSPIRGGVARVSANFGVASVGAGAGVTLDRGPFVQTAGQAGIGKAKIGFRFNADEEGVTNAEIIGFGPIAVSISTRPHVFIGGNAGIPKLGKIQFAIIIDPFRIGEPVGCAGKKAAKGLWDKFKNTLYDGLDRLTNPFSHMR